MDKSGQVRTECCREFWQNQFKTGLNASAGMHLWRTNRVIVQKAASNARSEPFFCALFSQAGSRFTIEGIQSRIIGKRNRFFSIASVINLWPSKGSTSKK